MADFVSHDTLWDSDADSDDYEADRRARECEVIESRFRTLGFQEGSSEGVEVEESKVQSWFDEEYVTSLSYSSKIGERYGQLSAMLSMGLVQEAQKLEVEQIMEKLSNKMRQSEKLPVRSHDIIDHADVIINTTRE